MSQSSSTIAAAPARYVGETISDEPVSFRRLSVVLPVYKCADCLEPLYERLVRSLRQLNIDYEIIFVEDCGLDGSWQLLEKIASADEKVQIFQHKRNYGQHAAVSTGLSRATGDVAVMMDADLQDPPELIGEFLVKAQEGNEIVLSVRKTRDDSMFRRAGSFLIWKLFPVFSRFRNGEYYGSFIMITRRVIDAYIAAPGRLYGNVTHLDRIPARVAYLNYQQEQRGAGTSSYDLRKLFLHFCTTAGITNSKKEYVVELRGSGEPLDAVASSGGRGDFDER